MNVSIIIVNYKTPELVVDCVKSIYEKTEGISYEIIIVDNNSEDNSVSIIKDKLGDGVTLISSQVNLGFGKANNLGAKYASGDYLFLLNSDTLLVNNAVKILYDYIKRTTEIGVVGGNLFTRELEPAPSYCCEFDTIEGMKKNARWSQIIKNIIGKRVLSSSKKKQITTFNYEEQPLKVAYIFGTDMMIPRMLYEKLNGFDSDFFMYAEEEELCWRVTKAGYQIWSIPEAKIIHFDGASTKEDNVFSDRQYTMRWTGRFTYYSKCYGKMGAERCYYYKKLELLHTEKIAILFHRKHLLDMVKCQMNCLDKAYQNLKDKKLV